MRFSSLLIVCIFSRGWFLGFGAFRLRCRCFFLGHISCWILLYSNHYCTPLSITRYCVSTAIKYFSDSLVSSLLIKSHLMWTQISSSTFEYLRVASSSFMSCYVSPPLVSLGNPKGWHVDIVNKTPHSEHLYTISTLPLWNKSFLDSRCRFSSYLIPNEHNA